MTFSLPIQEVFSLISPASS